MFVPVMQWQEHRHRGPCLCDNLPCLGPSQAMLIHQDPHELWHPNRGVRVIQLEGHLVWEGLQGTMCVLKTPDHILHTN